MYRFLLTRRWIGIHLFCLALMPLMIWLGFWQWHRYEHAHHSNQMQSRNLAAKPIDYASAVPGRGHRIGQDLWWRTVTARGHFDETHEVLARRRMSNEGAVGFYVVTPFVTTRGDVLWVNRGWVEQPDTSPTADPKVPAAPTGTLTVTGRLRPDEGGAKRGVGAQIGLPDKQVLEVNAEHLAKSTGLGAQPLPGRMDLTSTTPKASSSLEIPEVPGGADTGLHVAYTVNWWVFVLGVPVAWWKLMTRERDERAGRRPKKEKNEPDSKPQPSMAG
ncbi:hypothetical protein BIV57_02950 [Mangrovactinospora gilvigrisea]|uniref:SURF1-like protein n=1 Tax=Mangrovactinospora gilvigrisea TaxID=1428644 RepID=A0A1J7CH20_9ACTN|nr:SURF1 family protein [Mangrovactinospora gilvigrisea]OIV38938.1 hypothetical protein BIV57_02950 [Mangrovactinospora gilvigrisea]